MAHRRLWLTVLTPLIIACGHTEPAPQGQAEPQPQPASTPVVTEADVAPEVVELEPGPVVAVESPVSPPDAESGDASVPVKLQEAIWELERLPKDEAIESRIRGLEERLLGIFRDGPVEGGLKPLGGGRSETFLVSFTHGVKGVFKKNKENQETRRGNADLEVATYLVDKMLGFGLTPMTINYQLTIDGTVEPGSLMYFVAGTTRPSYSDMTDELKLFDWIIGNFDRHTGNFLMTEAGKVVAVDHDGAFGSTDRFMSAKYVADGVYESRIRAITKREWKEKLGSYITPYAFERFMERLQRAITESSPPPP